LISVMTQDNENVSLTIVIPYKRRKTSYKVKADKRIRKVGMYDRYGIRVTRGLLSSKN